MRRMKLKYEDDVPSSTQNDLKLEGVCWSHIMLNATIVFSGEARAADYWVHLYYL